jgi:hypothetical protein
MLMVVTISHYKSTKGYESRMMEKNLITITYRKLTFKTAIVVITERQTSIIVKRRYLPSNGTVNDVGGIISTSSKKNTVSESNILIHNDIFSPLSDGR